jgi:alkyldihydroxyacetonephosphate synthase
MGTVLSSSDLTTLVDGLSEIAGRDQVLEGDAARRAYAGDMSWLSIAAAAHGRPLSRHEVVVSPATADEVAAIVRLANARRVPITPVGGGSGVQGAANADRGGIALSLRRLNAVRAVDDRSMICLVEAGTLIRDFEQHLNARGLTFTHYPASAEWATVGGALAARGSGVLSSKYGKIEDHVLSIEVVTPTGEIVQTPSVPRHAAGPDLTQLLIGSEGTLGIITAVIVKVRALPAVRLFSTYAFSTLAEGIDAGRRIMTTNLRPAVMRLYDADAASHSLSRAVEAPLSTPTLVVVVDGDHRDVADAEHRAIRQICVDCGAYELGEAIAARWWDRRYAFYYPPFAPELPSIWCTIDVVADYAHIEAVYEGVTRAIRQAIDPKWDLQLVTHLSHWYDWGTMIYARFKIARGPDSLDEAVALHDAVVRDATRAALTAGAVLNDHHGIGMRLGGYMQEQFGPAGMDMLARIKRGLDPNNVLCPGKLGLPAT